MNNRKYYIINGSKNFFKKSLPKFEEEDVDTFSQLIKEADDCKVNGVSFQNYADNLVIRNDNYNGIVEQAHDRLGPLIEDLTEDDASIYIHNPPVRLIKYLKEDSSISIKYFSQEYYLERDEADFSNKMKSISNSIIGQDSAILEVSKSMWYLTRTNRLKPYVIMLYGNSSLGKTQLVREIANNFYNNDYFEKHLSMFQNNSYSDYFFGEKPNRATLGYELLERNSNLIFLDEIDKCPKYFYSAFYTLFDNKIFSDKTYDVNVSKSLIILTSNYLSENEMQRELGLPIYYRIDKFIEFSDFTSKTIFQITNKEINDRKLEYESYFTPEQIYASVSPHINSTGENARTIKYKVQKVIEDLLFQTIADNFIDLKK